MKERKGTHFVKRIVRIQICLYILIKQLEIETLSHESIGISIKNEDEGGSWFTFYMICIVIFVVKILWQHWNILGLVKISDGA